MGERRKHRVRGELRVHSHRYKLCKEFIAEGSKLYADALVREQSKISNPRPDLCFDSTNEGDLK